MESTETLRAEIDRFFAVARLGGDGWDNWLQTHGLKTHGDSPTPVGKVSAVVVKRVAEQLMAIASNAHQHSCADYLSRELRRFTGGLGAVFANAVLTTARTASAPAAVSTLRCIRCGAPREIEAIALCQYCGTAFFNPESPP